MKAARIALAMMLALLFALGAAAETLPETREDVIALEGMDEAVTLTRFDSERGYRLWVDAAMFAFVPAGEGNDIDAFCPANPEAVPGVSLSIHYSAQLGYAFGDAERDVRQNLLDNGFEVTDADAAALFPKYPAAGFHGVKGDAILEEYVIASGEGAFYLTLAYPLITAEGFGTRMRYMAATFEIIAAP